MEKLSALTLAVLLMAGHASAQTPLYVGAKGGISIPNLTAGNGSPVSSGYSSILGPYFGLFAERALHKHSRWSIQVEVNYSVQGGKKNGEQGVPTAPFQPYFPGVTLPEYVYANYDSKAQLKYLELPILVKYRIPLGKGWRLTLDGGVYMGYLLHANDLTKDSSFIYYDPQEEQQFPAPKQNFGGNEDITDQINRFNFGLQGGLGLEKKCGHGYVFCHAGGNYGLLNIQRYAVDGSNNTGAATIVLGYALKVI